MDALVARFLSVQRQVRPFLSTLRRAMGQTRGGRWTPLTRRIAFFCAELIQERLDRSDIGQDHWLQRIHKGFLRTAKEEDSAHEIARHTEDPASIWCGGKLTLP
jgi:hypothetical protein